MLLVLFAVVAVSLAYAYGKFCASLNGSTVQGGTKVAFTTTATATPHPLEFDAGLGKRRGKARAMAVDIDAVGGVHIALTREGHAQRLQDIRESSSGSDSTATVACPGKFVTQVAEHDPQRDVPAVKAWAEATLRDAYSGHMDFASHKALKAQEHDDVSKFRAEGGDNRSHIYGECYPSAMWEILETAVCTIGCADGVQQALSQYDFFDLGSGYGKFPMFAALAGVKTATGIELDSERHRIAAERQPRFAAYGCSALRYLHESFTRASTPWTRGTAPRVLFLDAVCWDQQMPGLAALMRGSEWGRDSVVAIMGKEFEPDSGLEEARDKIQVKVSWGHSTVHFYRKAASFAALDDAAVAPTSSDRGVREATEAHVSDT